MPRKILLSFPVQNNIKFLRMQMTSDMLLRKSSLASFPANLTLCCPAITPTDHHHHQLQQLACESHQSQPPISDALKCEHSIENPLHHNTGQVHKKTLNMMYSAEHLSNQSFCVLN